MNKIKKTLSSLRFARFVIFHPFKGFWELKAEKRGTVGAATSVLTALIAVYILRYQFTGFVLNYNEPNEMNVFMQISYVLFPFLVWCTANWSVTTLMDGEGTFRDIYIASAFALVPLLIINIPQLILSQVLVEDELVIYTLLDSAAMIWTAFLMIVALMTVHQYARHSCESNEKQFELFQNPRNRVKFRRGASGEDYSLYWWLRSPSVSYSTYFWFVYTGGYCNYYGSASHAYGVCPCFLI